MFKTHPNKADMRFIVLPVVREVLATSNDIAHDIDIIMGQYGMAEFCEGIHFDFSLSLLHGQPKLWQIYTLANLEKQKNIVLNLTVDDKGEPINHKDLLLERIVQAYGHG
jgi:hypothetical protein